MNVSSKYIIDIWEFMENYYGIIYDDNYKLVHDEMCYYLRNKNIFVKRIGFKEVKNAEILNGDIILVRDEEGKVAPYINPKRIEDLDLDEINSLNNKIGFSGIIENCENLKEIGQRDYALHLKLRSEIAPKKKRVRRRKFY